MRWSTDVHRKDTGKVIFLCFVPRGHVTMLSLFFRLTVQYKNMCVQVSDIIQQCWFAKLLQCFQSFLWIQVHEIPFCHMHAKPILKMEKKHFFAFLKILLRKQGLDQYQFPSPVFASLLFFPVCRQCPWLWYLCYSSLYLVTFFCL